MTGPQDRRPPVPHDTAPFTMPADTAARIAAYGTQAVRPASTETPVLEARDISKYFGRVIALEHVSLSVRPGDANEVVEAYRYVMQLRHQPAVLVLSRQPLPPWIGPAMRPPPVSRVAPMSSLTRPARTLNSSSSPPAVKSYLL